MGRSRRRPAQRRRRLRHEIRCRRRLSGQRRSVYAPPRDPSRARIRLLSLWNGHRAQLLPTPSAKRVRRRRGGQLSRTPYRQCERPMKHTTLKTAAQIIAFSICLGCNNTKTEAAPPPVKTRIAPPRASTARLGLSWVSRFGETRVGWPVVVEVWVGLRRFSRAGTETLTVGSDALAWSSALRFDLVDANGVVQSALPFRLCAPAANSAVRFRPASPGRRPFRTIARRCPQTSARRFPASGHARHTDRPGGRSLARSHVG